MSVFEVVKNRFVGALTRKGSTRSVALLRIALALIIWARFASQMALFATNGTVGVFCGVVFFFSSTMMLLGVCSRWSSAGAGATLFFVYYYFGVHLQIPTIPHHHVYLLAAATLLLIFTPCGGSYSFDLWWQRRRFPEKAAKNFEIGPLWGMSLIGFQVTMVYFWGVFQKLELRFLSGLRMQQIFMDHYTGSIAPQWFGFAELMMALAIATILVEGFLVFGLWLPRLKRFAIPIGLGFHALLFWTLPVSTFSVTICMLYLVFLDPDLVHQFLDRMQPRSLESRQ